MRDLADALKTFRGEGATRGMVLDLRNNPGGLFDQAVGVADKFINEGTIVTTVGANNTYLKPSYARGWRTEEGLPLVVLINQGSASASEIVSGALKYRRRAILLGSQTFGKGSVQQIFDLADGSALKLSVAQYLLPDDRSIQSVGVTPDLALTPVELPTSEKDREVRFEAAHRGRNERELKGSFTEWAAKAEKPLFSLSHLKEREPEDNRTAMELTRQEKSERLKKDFAIRLAKRILLASPRGTRQALLETTAELIPQVVQEEEERITVALKKLGIDWSKPALTFGQGPQQASLSEVAMELDFSPASAEAGSEVTLSLAVTNQGSKPLSRVRAITEADLAMFNGREFLLGRIAPGETRRWSLPLTLPKNLDARQEKVEAVVRGARGKMGRAQGLLTVVPLPRPQFSLRYNLFDNGEVGSKGNGDGRPQRGETLVLRLTATNRGPGVSEKNVAVFKPKKGLEGVFIKVGRKELGKMAAGEARTVNIVFDLQSNFNEGELPAELSVMDTVFRNGFTAEVDLGKPSSAAPFRPPTITLTGDSPPLAQTHETLSLSGIITDDRQVASIIIFANNRKVFYRSGAPMKAKSLAFAADLKLKEGVNKIFIIAQDDQKLATRRRLVVRRDKAPTMARRTVERSDKTP